MLRKIRQELLEDLRYLPAVGVVAQFVSKVVKRIIKQAFRNNFDLLLYKAHFVAKHNAVDSFEEED